MSITQMLFFEPMTCGVCSIPFALERSHLDSLKSTKRTFYCPNGDLINFLGESDKAKVDRLTRQLQHEQEVARIARAEAMGERMKKEKALAKVRRARNGVCVDCNRTFVNVQRHRASKHSGDGR